MDWFQSFISWTKEKINSPLYITFFVAVVLWNWKSFYVLFWLDSTNFSGINQLQYALMIARKIGHTHIYQLDWILNHLWFFGVPTFITFLVVWYLPKLHNLAHKRYLEFRFERELEFDRQKTAYQSQKATVVRGQREALQVTQREYEAISAIEENLPDHTRWEKEYKFMTSNLKETVALLPRMIYQYGGTIQDEFSRNITADHLALLDSNHLISFPSSNQISLTEKGKFFVRQFLAENNHDQLPPQN